MEYYVWLPIFLLFFILWLQRRKREAAAIACVIHRKKQNRETTIMKELAKQFVGKECLVYTLTGSDSLIKGTVKEVTDGGIIVERPDGIEAVNLDYIARIREWPRNEKGKKKIFFE